MRLQHGFDPVYDANSRVLVLGSFPSVLSRKNGFYYGHPSNRFLRVMAELLDAELPKSIEEKKTLLLKNHIALWDVVQACEIEGSKDSSIRNVVPNDVSTLLAFCPIQRIYANGATAHALYQKHLLPVTKRDIRRLPSTSSANAAWPIERLIPAWRVILPDLNPPDA
ncbi:MAG: DNA-deoxyinosine glycosylase [Christensenellales bacterium]